MRFSKVLYVDSGVRQRQNSCIVNDKFEPSFTAKEKLASGFEVSIVEFFKSDVPEKELRLLLIQKIKMIVTLPRDKQ